MKSMPNPRLSVIIPAYNEEENLKKDCLSPVYEFLSKQKYSYEVLIVDDGSKDDTINLVKKFIRNKPTFKLIENPHGGKAITVMTGLLRSQGEIALFTDTDQATPISEINKFLPQFEKGSDIVIGSRHGRKGAPPIRRLTAWGFVVLRNIIVGLPFVDTQCGFKAFTRDAVNKVFPKVLARWEKLKTNGAAVNAGFDVEVLFLAKQQKLKITEIPVEWHHVGSARVPFLKNAIEATLDMLRIRANALLGKYS